MHARTDARTDGRRTDFGTKLMYPIFLTKKAGLNIVLYHMRSMPLVANRLRFQDLKKSDHTKILMAKTGLVRLYYAPKFITLLF